MAYLNPDLIRKDFPILERRINGKRLIYLDNAATSQRPRQVIDAITQFYSTYNANIHRAVHTLSQEATELYEEAHEKVRNFINAKEMSEIIFTRNTTESVNLVAYSLMRDMKPGDEIVTTVMEHHSNLVPWQMLRDEAGIVLKYARLNPDGSLDLDHIKSLITEKTKIVAVTHISNVLGLINPVKEISKMAHDKGALVLIDAAQSAPHIKIDVQEIDCDFLAFSSHKMLGPTGIGVLYGKKEYLERMEPFLRGGDMISTVTLEGATWNKLPWKFEAGTSNFADGYAFGVAIDYLRKIGMENIANHEFHLANYTINKLLNEIPDIKILGPLNGRIGVIAFYFDDISPDLIGILLNERYGIAIRTGCHCAQPLHEFFGIRGTARASFYLYNTQEEADIFVEGLKEIVKEFRR
ncbi:MAG: aminotransferase class V-fold PLP-dependent enzyme [Candidatus Hydrothermia bacterium]